MRGDEEGEEKEKGDECKRKRRKPNDEEGRLKEEKEEIDVQEEGESI